MFQEDIISQDFDFDSYFSFTERSEIQKQPNNALNCSMDSYYSDFEQTQDNSEQFQQRNANQQKSTKKSRFFVKQQQQEEESQNVEEQVNQQFTHSESFDFFTQSQSQEEFSFKENNMSELCRIIEKEQELEQNQYQQQDYQQQYLYQQQHQFIQVQQQQQCQAQVQKPKKIETIPVDEDKRIKKNFFKNITFSFLTYIQQPSVKAQIQKELIKEKINPAQFFRKFNNRVIKINNYQQFRGIFYLHQSNNKNSLEASLKQKRMLRFLALKFVQSEFIPFSMYHSKIRDFNMLMQYRHLFIEALYNLPFESY